MKYKGLAIVLTIVVALGVIAVMLLQEYSDALDSYYSEITKAQHIQEMPDSYCSQAPLQGTLETVEYEITIQDKILEEDTVSGKYASNGAKPPKGAPKEHLAKEFSFTDSDDGSGNTGITMTKNATVYLPYGYDPNEKYPIMYLVHGRGGSYKTWLGTAENPRPLKNILDNMILNQEIEPLIVVCPELTYAYGLDDRIMDGMSHEISHELMTAVESKYSTYAEGTNPEDFEASRDARAMAGFSMGGSVTWHMLKDHVEYFRYFMPMSMALYFDRNGYSETKNEMAIRALEKNITAKGYTSDDIRLYAATGSSDHKAEAIVGQVALMDSDTELFNYTEKKYTKGNVMLRCWPERMHRYTEAFPYIYDGLKQFYKASGADSLE